MKVHVASGMRQAGTMKREGKEPIVVEANSHEVHVFVRSERIARVLWHDPSWHMSIPEKNGYENFIYTRLNKQQVVEFLSGVKLPRRTG